jgi:inner membrane protein
MDNLCHTLVGAAIGEAGLKRWTRFGNPVLMIAANLPDIDVLAFATSTPAVALRRGWTHGILAQALLPIACMAVVMLVDRWRVPRAGVARARAGPVLLLSYIGVLSHVALDWLNSYGVRLLKPFSDRWFYGDAVFIIDPWLWLILGAGVLVARRYHRRSAAAVAVVAAAVYISTMVWSARMARQHVIDIWTDLHGNAPASLMVGPRPATPFERQVIIEDGDDYVTASYDVRTGRLEIGARIPANRDEPAAIRAREDRRVRAVLVWARFPFYHLTPTEEGTVVALGDVRFASRVGGITVVVPDSAAAGDASNR